MNVRKPGTDFRQVRVVRLVFFFRDVPTTAPAAALPPGAGPTHRGPEADAIPARPYLVVEVHAH